MRKLTPKAVSSAILSMVIAATSCGSAFGQEFRGPDHGDPRGPSDHDDPRGPIDHDRTATPIKHLVIIFGENESFDHYFGTYPMATNPPGEPAFTATRGTPPVNGLTKALLTNNPNLNSANGAGATNPFRLDRSQAHTSSMNHNYGPEQQAFDDGKMDLFPKFTGRAGTGGTGVFETTGLVMGYFDGNTVTALWNYAQHFAMSDNSYSSTFGPSSPGAVNLVSGQTNGAKGFLAGPVLAQQAALGLPNAKGTTPVAKASTASQGNNILDDGQGGFTMIGDSDPVGDACSSTSSPTTEMTGTNIGDLMNARHITWGWFEGGFDLTLTNANGTTGCQRSSTSITLNNSFVADYVPHHQPFQYYPSTRNPLHTRPSSIAAIGTSHDGGANHQYDTHDFFDALQAHNLPSVTFLKAPAFQDAHPSNSDPLDEQTFVVTVLNALQQSEFWDDTAVVIAYDDSDGWYDHMNHVFNRSTSSQDFLIAAGQCGPLSGHNNSTSGTVPATALHGVNGKPVNGRCGYGTRQPLLVISRFARPNFVDHDVTDQSSIIRFVEDNWLDGERIPGSFDRVAGTLENMLDFHQRPTPKLILDPTLGTPTN